MSRESLIAHEAAHAAMCAVLGCPPARAWVVEHGDREGAVWFKRNGLTAKSAHDAVLVALAGAMCDDTPDWPPTWPIATSTSDERVIDGHVRWLALTEGHPAKQIYDQLVQEAKAISGTPEFGAFEQNFRAALETRPNLDDELCALVVDTTNEQRKSEPMQRPKGLQYKTVAATFHCGDGPPAKRLPTGDGLDADAMRIVDILNRPREEVEAKAVAPQTKAVLPPIQVASFDA